MEKAGLLFRKLKWIVQALASAAPEQIKLFPGFVNVADELALIWEDVLNDLDNLARKLPKSVILSVNKLDDKILSIGGSGNAQLWAEAALYESSHWEDIRALAKAVAEEMNWSISSPSTANGVYVGPPEC